MNYIKRELLEELKKWIDRREILAIQGARQTGKTTLLELLRAWLIKEKKIPPQRIISLTFEDRELLAQFEKNPKDLIMSFVQGEGTHYVLIDEAQYAPRLGQHLKLLYDTQPNLKFLITGSSSLALMQATAAALVGRIFFFELPPLHFAEFLAAADDRLARVHHERRMRIVDLLREGREFPIPADDIFLPQFAKHWERYVTYGGYPAVVNAHRPEEQEMVLKHIFNTYVERDIVAFLQMTDTVKFTKLVSLLSAMLGGMLTYATLAQSCNSYHGEILKMLDVLQQTYVIRLLRPFHRSMVTELRKNPKAYFTDLGLRNSASRNFTPVELRNDQGALAENFLCTELSAMLGDAVKLSFWRTTAKAEVDFIVESGQHLIPIEVKYAAFGKAKIPKSLRSFIMQYRPQTAIIVTGDFWGTERIDGTVVYFIPIYYL